MAGGTNGHKHDLFDTSSRSGDQPDLFDNNTRKRKAGAMASPEERRYDGYGRHAHAHAQPQPPQKQKKKHCYPSSLDLGAMLYPDRIKPEAYRNIQGVLKDQDRKIQELLKDDNARERIYGDSQTEICKRGSKIDSLNTQVEGLQQHNHRLREDKERQERATEHTLKRSREKREELQALVKEKDGFLTMGTKALKENTEVLKRVESENTALRGTITERDTMISKLNEQIWRVTSTTGADHAHARMEAQAQQTLNMVTGLQKEVEVKDERVKHLEDQVEKMNGIIKDQNAAKVELQREAEGLKRELKREREIGERATLRAKEAKEVAESQEALIERILEENKKLVREV